MRMIIVLLIVLLTACGESGTVPTSDEITVCRSQDQKPDSPPGFASIGDGITHKGFLYLSDTNYEYRPCNQDEIYLVDAPFAVIDALDQFAAVHASSPAGPFFMRFRGIEIECTDSLPDRYANAVNITELVAQSKSPPAEVDIPVLKVPLIACPRLNGNSTLAPLSSTS